MNWRRVWLTVVGLTVTALLVALASGCGGGDNAAPVSIGGFIVDVTTGLPIGNVVVTAGGQSGTSRSSDGRFTISGLAPGNYALVVQPGALFVAVPGPPPRVTVGAGAPTEVGNVLIIDRALLPPSA